MNTKGFYIVSPGDPSVGIFPSQWTLSGDIYFNDKEELEEFRTDLKNTFERIADDAHIETFEEREEENSALEPPWMKDYKIEEQE